MLKGVFWIYLLDFSMITAVYRIVTCTWLRRQVMAVNKCCSLVGLWGGCKAKQCSWANITQRLIQCPLLLVLLVNKRWPGCIKYSPEASPPALVSSKKIRFVALETTLLRAEVQ